ncbi:ferritin-like domain-containing protein [Novosphingobium umbonatum]|uniref:Ferritin-like domain-containing protein n=1 Tax=Novosphingobium umbonatum TaxID=1908524 RepID=A0A437N586_9SPHN|nr:ferritin-like domain-containing protein [Novosphingobium umbonatum]RVU05076.1 ferritin-like domain-containing protein [Novosphingobium umbonatum]
MNASLSHAIAAVLNTADPRAKAMRTRAVVRDWRLGRLAWDFGCAMPERPVRPEKPELLPPGQMPKRGKGGSRAKRIALWHALAHIEFVAIDLALDMAGRFGAEMEARFGHDVARGFVDDFLCVAADEAMHFAIIQRHLASMGATYGDLPAHDGLWEAAGETAHDLAARLAVVPMVLEARGLDVTPATIERVEASGDHRGARILNRIFNDEIRHVRYGSEHFSRLAHQSGDSPDSLWKSLVTQYFRGKVKPPFNDSARQAAGLSRPAYLALACMGN